MGTSKMTQKIKQESNITLKLFDRLAEIVLLGAILTMGYLYSLQTIAYNSKKMQTVQEFIVEYEQEAFLKQSIQRLNDLSEPTRD
jgi:hypothetical protein